VIDNIAKKFGVEVIHGDEIESVIPKNGVPSYVKTKKGREIQTDMIGVGLGIALNTQILAHTPVEVRQGVVVNEYLETNVPGVYSAGDVAEFYDPTAEMHYRMGTWNNAARWSGGTVPYASSNSQIAAQPRQALAAAKRAVNHALESSYEGALEFESYLQEAQAGSQEFVDGVQAFLARRKPR